jgi:hypothetical protein
MIRAAWESPPDSAFSGPARGRVRAGDYMKVPEPAFATPGLQLRNEAAAVGEVALCPSSEYLRQKAA